MFIWDFVANPVMESILDWFYSQMVGFLGAFFAQMGNMGVELFDLSWVRSVVRFFSQLGWALFAVSVVVSAFECGIEYASGRGNLQQPALNALKGFFAVSLFTTVPVRLYALSVSLQGTFAMEITGAGKSIGELGNEILTDLEGAGLMDIAAQAKWGLGTNPIMLLFAMILMAYAVIKVFFSNLKRGGILLIQIAVGSLYMFSIPRGYTDGFTQWCKQVIGLCLTAFLQATILVAGLMVFSDKALLGLGLMLAAGEVPRIAGAFGHHQSQYHERRLHRPGCRQYHPHHCPGGKMTLTLGSLFDGIGGFPLAAIRQGITPLWASEIESFPIQVTKHHFPETLHMGDIIRLDGAKLAPVDIICGGSPCQDLSVASCTRAGLAGARSGLFLEQIRVTKEMRDADIRRGRTGKSVRPRWFCWENVPGVFSSGFPKGEDFRFVLEQIAGIAGNSIPFTRPHPWGWQPAGKLRVGAAFSLAWKVFDAQYWPGTPQRRRRVFLVADFAGQSAPKILFDQESLPGHSAQGEGAGQASPAPAPCGPPGAGGAGRLG